MKTTIALVGRPNVGKSTLFNKLTRTRDALVADFPGLTRDRKYGIGRIGEHDFIVIDTGGLTGDKDVLDQRMEQQTRQAITEADVVLFLVDGRAGLTAADEIIANQLRQLQKEVHLVVNKIDGIGEERAGLEFYALGMGEPFTIAASHNRGINSMIDTLFMDIEPEEVDEERDHAIRVAIVGRPNVGKSTLINRVIGDERVVAMDMPGTTRDSITVPLERDGKRYDLIDTAGVRRRGKVKETVEKFSVIKSLQAVDDCHVAILVLDAHQGLSDQDISLLGYILDSGRALVVAINKWDGLTSERKQFIKDELERRLGFLKFARFKMISALHGTGVGDILPLVNRAYDAAMIKMSTPELTRMLEHAIDMHQPPMVSGRRIKLRYAHQGGMNPPVIIIHGNQTEKVPGSYQRYLINYFLDELKLEGTPMRVIFRTGDNPFQHKRNKKAFAGAKKKRK